MVEGFKVCPQAQINDGLLDNLLCRTATSFGAAAKLFLKAKEGKHIHDQAIHFAQAKRIQLSFAHPLPAQIDGERFHDNEVSVQVFLANLKC